MTERFNPREEIYDETIGGLRTGSEVLADLEAEAETDRERLERHGPAFVSGFPCAGCGAYQKFPLATCPLCGHERRAAA